jgi:hypothetical protein
MDDLLANRKAKWKKKDEIGGNQQFFCALFGAEAARPQLAACLPYAVG